jgi:two-component system chemotaxis sensor kinase CheA
MLDVFIYETTQNIEQIETSVLISEKENCFTPDAINEIFRAMHTIKGSSAIMKYDNIASVTHSIEDLFYYIREEKPKNIDCRLLSDMVLEGVDFIKLEMEKVKNADKLDGDPTRLIKGIKNYLHSIKGEDDSVDTLDTRMNPIAEEYYCLPRDKSWTNDNKKIYEAVIFFEDGCEMENVRAFGIIHRLKEITEEFRHIPENIIDDDESVRIIREQGFTILFRSDKDYRELYDFFIGTTAFVRELELHELSEEQVYGKPNSTKMAVTQEPPAKISELKTKEQFTEILTERRNSHQNIISVDVVKLDKLMDLMGEMVIAEAMVTQNPELQGIKLNSYYKASRQLRKITGEMQDMVMSIRMVPLSSSFRKMYRLVRDMSRKLDKKVELTLVGEETEVDKDIIEHISDPLMHLVRNAIDHGIESPNVRVAAGKPETGKITLEAKNAGSDVLIIVKDDGRGIDKEKVLQKARENGLIKKPENELTDKEIYNLLLLPGFSTNDKVTEFSGRGVGMDVVTKNLEAVGGSVSMDSVEGNGTVITLKIPLTLAIIDGMNIRVGNAKYTIPTTSIRETFQAKADDLILDPEGNEMIMVRGECYPILRLHKLFEVKSDITDLTKGIMLMIEQDEKCLSLFADELVGQHQVVVKALPSYMKNLKRIDGLTGCTLLGDGSISLILNTGGLLGI